MTFTHIKTTESDICGSYFFVQTNNDTYIVEINITLDVHLAVKIYLAIYGKILNQKLQYIKAI